LSAPDPVSLTVPTALLVRADEVIGVFAGSQGTVTMTGVGSGSK
jgi:hypothetical protein